MSGDAEHRMLASGQTIEVTTLQIGKGKKDKGKEVTVTKRYRLRPVMVKHLCDLEQDALQAYRRSYLNGIKAGAELLNGNGEDLLQREILKAAQWDVTDLPQKTVNDVSKVPLNSALVDKLQELLGEAEELPDTEEGKRGALLHFLESKQLTSDDIHALTNTRPTQAKIRYDQWWVSNTFTGMLGIVLVSLRYDEPTITEEDVSRWPFMKLVEAARTVEVLSAAEMGNG